MILSTPDLSRKLAVTMNIIFSSLYMASLIIEIVSSFQIIFTSSIIIRFKDFNSIQIHRRAPSLTYSIKPFNFRLVYW